MRDAFNKAQIFSVFARGILAIAFQFSILLLSNTATAGSNNGLIYSGRILKPDGSALADSSVSFQVKVIGKSTLLGDGTAASGTEKCTLFIETHTIDMSNSAGMFELSIGEGSAQQWGSGVSSLARLFINPPVDLTAPASTSYAIPAVPSSCTSGQSNFLPNSISSDRELEVSVTSGATSLTLNAMVIRSVPWAMQAAQVGGYSSIDLLKVGSAKSTTYRTVTTGQASFIVNLLNESSNIIDAQTHRISNVVDPTADQDVATKAYVDSLIVAAGAGTVTSVGLSAPNIFTVAGSPVSGAGTLSFSLASQSSNFIFAAPDATTGTPTFRAMVANDLPTVPISKGGTGLTSLTANKIFLTNGTATGFTYDSCVNGEMLKLVGGVWTCTTATSGTVTSIGTGTGLTGGTITGAGTISLASVANNSILANVSGASAAPSATSLSALLDSALTTDQGSLLYRGASGWSVLAPGTSGNVLQTQGAGANPTWAAASAGTVTSVGMSLPSELTVSSSPVTGSGTLSATWASQSTGRVFAAPSGAAGSPTFRALVAADMPSLASGWTGALPIANGGTGQTTTSAAFDALSPLTTKGDIVVRNSSNNIRLAVGSDGQVLTADSAQASGVKWATPTSGTVTSVALSAPSIFSVAGSPISVAGTLSFSLASQSSNFIFAAPDATTGTPTFRAMVANDLPTVPISKGGTGLTSLTANKIFLTNGTATGFTYDSCVNGEMLKLVGGVWTCTTATSGTVTSIGTGTGLTGGTITGTGTISLANIANNSILANVSGSSAAPGATTLSALLDSALTTAQGSLFYRGATGWSVLAPGTSGNVLQTQGAGADPTWAAPASGSGSVTSVALSLPSELTVSNSPVTGAGTLSASWASQSTGRVFAAPSGAAGTPSFRALVAADLPSAPYDSTYFKQSGNAFGSAAVLGTTDANALAFKTSNTEYMRISSSGAIGIGTTNPLDQLSIATAPVANANNALLNLTNTTLGGSANGTYLGANPASGNADFLNFRYNGSNRFKIDKYGNTTIVDGGSSADLLNLTTAYGSSGIAAIKANVTMTGGSSMGYGMNIALTDSTTSTGSFRGIYLNTGALSAATGEKSLLRMDVNSSNIITVSADGYVGVGQSTPVSWKSPNSTRGIVIGDPYSGKAGLTIAGAQSGSDGTFGELAFYGNGYYSKIDAQRYGANNSHKLGFWTINAGSISEKMSLLPDGTLRLNGSTSGYVGLAAAASSGSTTYTLPANDGTSGYLLATNGSGTLAWTAPSSGTVGSVGISLPAELTVSGSPVTGSGTLTAAWASQSTGRVFAAPSGSAGTPTFRSLALADLPAGVVTSIATGTGLTGGTITSSGTISLASIANNSILANVSGSSAAPSATTLSTLLDSALTTAQGSILFRNATVWTVLAPGTSGNYLQTQGSGANPVWAAASGGGGSVNLQEFTSSGTWTKPGSGTTAEIECWGGGGSGAKGSASATMGGGGGGGYNRLWIKLSSLGATETVTIGAGGTAVSTANTAGNTGGNSTFGSWLTAYGGGKGDTAGQGGGGGGSLGAGSAGTAGAGHTSHSSGGTPGYGYACGCTYCGSSATPGNFGGGAGASYANGTTNVWYAASGSEWGGGGGGGTTGATSGGTSHFGGNGGAGGTTSSGTAGTVPGGGGGATNTGASSGAGGAGYCRVIVY